MEKITLEHIRAVNEQGRFKPDWQSLSDISAPKWFRDGKFGIFIHWGAYAVPAFANEWYPRNMYIQGMDEFKHQVDTYGPHKDFGYKDFIPMFKAEKFDAEAWAELFSRSGARYVTPVAEHHDGFQMYDSALSHWNSVEMGPKRDVLGELKSAIERQGMKFCASSHRIEHWWFLGHGKDFDSDITNPIPRDHLYWPSNPEPKEHFSLNEITPSVEFMEDWLLRTCELVENYRPSLIYFDWWVQIEAMKPYLKEFAAFAYNLYYPNLPVITYKLDAFPYGSAVLTIERGGSEDIQLLPWQCDTAAARFSWCYTEQNVYKTTEEIVGDLIDTVSKNGCLMLNIGPKADGTITAEETKILLEIGEWLNAYGEAIYETRPFKVFGEGTTVVEQGQFTDGKPKQWNETDIRFTQKGGSIYAILLKPGQDVLIKILGGGSKIWHGVIKSVTDMDRNNLPYEQTAEALNISGLQSARKFDGLPMAIKINLG
jgi:alpha-L-fucosidase